MMESNKQTKILEQLLELLAPAKTSEKNDANSLLLEVLARLDKLESQISVNQSSSVESTLAIHPSQQKFQIAEVNEILLPSTNDKACRFEPDKPCDYCSMCSSLGF